MIARAAIGVAGSVLLAGPVAGQSCTVDSGTFMERAVACASEAQGLRHDEMVMALDALTSGVLPPTYDTRGLLDSQAMWEVHADATCAADAAFYGGGKLGLKARYDCLAAMAAARRDYLLDFAARVREARGLPPAGR